MFRQKMGMLLDTLKDEESGAHIGDDLLKTMEEIAFRSATERREKTPEKWVEKNLLLFENKIQTFIFLLCIVTKSEPRKRRFSFGKTEKDKINTKERTSRLMKRSEKEAVQCRANSLKRIIHNIIEHVDAKNKSEGKFRKMSLRANQRFIPTSSSETSPCTSPLPMPSANFATSSARLTCISPLPDIRRDSVDENFLNTLSIPVPRQFADDSRRNSGVPEKYVNCIMLFFDSTLILPSIFKLGV
jgi:diacylglycerol kinase (ATP)